MFCVACFAVASTFAEQPKELAHRLYDDAFKLFADDGAPQAKFRDAADAYIELRRKGFSDLDTAPFLAKIYLELADYQKSASELQRWEAVGRSDSSTAFRKRLDIYNQAVEYFKSALPKGKNFRRVAPVQIKGKKIWVCITAEPGSAGNPKETLPQFWVTTRKAEIWVSTPSGLQRAEVKADSRDDIDEYHELTLVGRDLDGDGNEEILLDRVYFAADCTPSNMLVLREKNSRWSLAGISTSLDPIILKPFGKKIAIQSVESIGLTLSVAEQPRFPTFETIDNGKWVDNGALFPAEYKSQLAYIQKCLQRDKESRADYELIAHLGACYHYLGKPSEAKRLYAKAARILKHKLSRPLTEYDNRDVLNKQLATYLAGSKKG